MRWLNFVFGIFSYKSINFIYYLDEHYASSNKGRYFRILSYIRVFVISL